MVDLKWHLDEIMPAAENLASFPLYILEMWTFTRSQTHNQLIGFPFQKEVKERFRLCVY